MPYLEKVIKIGTEVKPGSLHHVMIRHDDNCDIWKTGICSCDPDVGLFNVEDKNENHS